MKNFTRYDCDDRDANFSWCNLELYTCVFLYFNYSDQFSFWVSSFKLLLQDVILKDQK